LGHGAFTDEATFFHVVAVKRLMVVGHRGEFATSPARCTN